MSGEIWCTDGRTVYTVDFDQVKAGTGPPRFRIRLKDGSVHRLVATDERTRLGLGRMSLAEFACRHPQPAPGRACIPGTNILRAAGWSAVKPLSGD